METIVDNIKYDHIPAGIGVLFCGPEGYHIESVNERMCEITGRTEEQLAEIVNGKIDMLVHPEDVDAIRSIAYRAKIGGGRFKTVLRIQAEDGTSSWVDVRVNAEILDAYSQRLYLAVEDINDQKENELKLERTYEELLGVMNNTPGGIILFGIRNSSEPFITFASPGMYRLLGGTSEEVDRKYNRDFFRAVHPDDREMMMRHMEEGLRNLSQFQTTLRLRTMTDEYIWLDASATIEVHDGQKSIYVIFTNTSADRENRRMLEHVLDIFVRGQYDLICLVDGRDGSYRVLSANSRTEERVPDGGADYDADMRGLIGRYVVDDEKNSLEGKLSSAELLKMLSEEDEKEFLMTTEADGELHYRKLWATWVDRGEQLAALVLSDYTEMRKEQIERQKALMTALKAAEQANVAKSEFLSRMSHDIRTPLNAIIGFAEMGLDDEASGTADRERFEKIDRASKYLLMLVNDVLDMSRIESGKLNLQEENFELRVLLESINSIMYSQCRSKGLEYRYSIDDNVRMNYIGDRTKLQQVIVNIMGNAVKFTPAGGKLFFDVDEAAAYDDYAMLRFTVTDTGIGISKDFLPHLFEPFSQEARDGAVYRGTGLGLAICRSIVSMMKGSIDVESEPGRGSRFAIEVKMGIPAASAEPEAAGQKTAGGEGADFNGRRILVAEDNPMNKEIVVYLLKKTGAEVDVAENGRIACSLFAASAQGYYDAVLMDIRMPEMDGIEAARTIRGMDRGDAAGIPIIALSADAFEEDVSRSLANGINAHLIKPIVPGLLYSTLEKFFSKGV